jgi:uncharacterized membrane protein (UPF0182 family)
VRGGRTALAEPPRRSRTLVTTLVVAGVLLFAFVLFTSFYTDLLWYQSVDASSVFTTQLVVRVVLLLLFGALMAFAVGLNMWIAYRVRPVFRLTSPEQQSLERYRMSLEPLRKAAFIGIPLVLGLLAGVSATAEWRTVLLWRNGGDFGVTDPNFGMDVSFYVFSLPFYRFILGFLFASVIIGFLAALVVHYIYGGIRLQPADDRVSRAAQAHLSILIGLFVLLKAVAYYLDRFELSLSQDDYVAGVTYKDVNALIPGLQILMWISLICAVLFFITAFRQGFTLALTSLVLLVGSALVVGSLYPAFVQQVQVRPTELVRETPYIQNNIDATRASYALDEVEVTSYAAADVATPEAVQASAGTIGNIRLLDPAVVSPTFKALQAIRNFYAFPAALDVDRYTLDDKQRGAIIAVRELNLAGLGEAQRNWANDHVVYTHGFGVVAAYDNTQDAGKPAFFEKDLPPEGLLDVEQPRIYFGENSPEYSIVGGPEDGPKRELDYPTDTGQASYTYTGDGGVSVGSFFNKLLFATKYQEPNIILSDLLNEESKILEVRDPRERVQKVAPWLQVDADPYPVVVEGRVKWFIDAYTTTNNFPNATSLSFGDATADTVTRRASNIAAQPRDQVNYIRNSVKATVDAYDGTVTLYEWDTEDPILQAWMKAFPGIVESRDSMPQPVLDHVRYPEDIFKVQRQIFSRYHVTDPEGFYSGQDFWNVPNDPTKPAASTAQPPYYLQVQMPGTESTAFSLTTTYAPQRRQTLAAFMAVNSEPGPEYGKIRVLQLPSNTTIPGPAQVQNNFESDPIVAQQLSLLRRGGSDVELGNLLSLPVAGGVLYVEPVYIRATGAEGFPLLQKVLVGFGNKVAFEDTLAEALAQVFGTAAGGDNKPPTEPTDPDGSGGDLTAEQRLVAAIAEAQAAYDDGRAALARGDFAAYGLAQERLERALASAAAAQRELGFPVTEPTPDPSVTAEAPSPTPTQSTTAMGRWGDLLGSDPAT